jgi:hypothetical protein
MKKQKNKKNKKKQKKQKKCLEPHVERSINPAGGKDMMKARDFLLSYFILFLLCIYFVSWCTRDIV